MITFVSLCIQVATLLLSFASFLDAGPYSGRCKQTCEKYRQTDEAFALDCDDHDEDSECRKNCGFCQDMCTDQSHKKVYSCPENPVTKTDMAAWIATVSWFAIAGILLFVVVGGILCAAFLSRSRRGQGAMGVAPMYPAMGERSIYPTVGTMSTSTMSYSQQQQYQTRLSTSSSGSTSG